MAFRHIQARPPSSWLDAAASCLFVRRRCYERLGMFREDMGGAGDYELMLRFLLKGKLRAVMVPDVWVAMRAGGASNVSFAARIRANNKDRRAWRVNNLRPWPWMRIMKPLRKFSQFWMKGGDERERAIVPFWEDYLKFRSEPGAGSFRGPINSVEEA